MDTGLFFTQIGVYKMQVEAIERRANRRRPQFHGVDWIGRLAERTGDTLVNVGAKLRHYGAGRDGMA